MSKAGFIGVLEMFMATEESSFAVVSGLVLPGKCVLGMRRLADSSQYLAMGQSLSEALVAKPVRIEPGLPAHAVQAWKHLQEHSRIKQVPAKI
jgi:hypothetical protein